MPRVVRDSRWKEQVKDLFSMHREERRGVLALVLLLVVLSMWVYYEQWYRTPKAHDLAPIKAQMEAWLAEQEALRPDTVAIKPFPFDPNTIGREEWRALGLSDRQVDGVERYLDKGGRFRTKKDLGKMYSLKPEQFAALEPFILLPDSLARRSYPERPRKQFATWDSTYADERERREYPRTELRKVELNTADTASLIALPGIGPSFARGIVKYRSMLGGYVSLDQLSEVFVLKDKPDAILKLKELLVIDTLAVRRLPINSCTVEELAAHPYARWRLAKPLIAYRTQHGPFKQVEDIRGCPLVNDTVFRKLAPYLSVE